jgi:hypothetical protein
MKARRRAEVTSVLAPWSSPATRRWRRHTEGRWVAREGHRCALSRHEARWRRGQVGDGALKPRRMRRSGESWGADPSIRRNVFHGRKGMLVGIMWVDAVAHGASMERRKAGAHGAQGCNGTTSEAPMRRSPKRCANSFRSVALTVVVVSDGKRTARTP